MCCGLLSNSAHRQKSLPLQRPSIFKWNTSGHPFVKRLERSIQQKQLLVHDMIKQFPKRRREAKKLGHAKRNPLNNPNSLNQVHFFRYFSHCSIYSSNLDTDLCNSNSIIYHRTTTSNIAKLNSKRESGFSWWRSGTLFSRNFNAVHGRSIDESYHGDLEFFCFAGIPIS